MTPGPPAEPGDIVGRGAEIDVLQSFIERAGLVGEALVLVGDAGVGKTALLDVAARHALRSASAWYAQPARSSKPTSASSALHQSLLPLLNGIEELRPLHRDALSVALGLGEGQAPDRLVVSGAALELVRRAGQEQPLLIVLDDVFWMDRPSAEVLGFVARRLAGSHVGLLAALRTATGSVFDGLRAAARTSSSRWTRTRRTVSCERGSRSSVRTCAGVCSPRRPATRWHCSSCRRR